MEIAPLETVRGKIIGQALLSQLVSLTFIGSVIGAGAFTYSLGQFSEIEPHLQAVFGFTDLVLNVGPAIIPMLYVVLPLLFFDTVMRQSIEPKLQSSENNRNISDKFIYLIIFLVFISLCLVFFVAPKDSLQFGKFLFQFATQFIIAGTTYFVIEGRLSTNSASRWYLMGVLCAFMVIFFSGASSVRQQIYDFDRSSTFIKGDGGRLSRIIVVASSNSRVLIFDGSVFRFLRDEEVSNIRIEKSLDEMQPNPPYRVLLNLLNH